jgi:hypothetical protein
MKIEIKCRFTGKVLFEHDAENNTTKLTVEAAVRVGASLDGASLVGASLDGARLVGASLVGASLDGASLVGASLDGARLVGASLVGASLDGASLVGASLDGASLDRASLDRARLVGASLVGASLDNGEKLKGERPILQIGPLGSRCAYFVAYLSDKGVRLRAGCFYGTTAEFRAKLKETHDGNQHAVEYKAALNLIETHAKLWGDK